MHLRSVPREMLKASADYFFQNQLFLKHSFRNTVRESNGLDQEADERHELLVLIQTDGNGYQQTTKVTARKEIRFFILGYFPLIRICLL